MRKFKSALLGLILCVFSFVGAEEAAARPEWLECSFYPSLVITGKTPGAADYYSLKIVVEHTNKSEDKIITAIFDKTLRFSGLLKAGHATKESTTVIKSTKVNKMEVYPGQSVKLAYLVPLNKFNENVIWSAVHSVISKNGLKKINQEKDSKGKLFPNMHLVFDKRKYSYDCKVRTE